MGRWRIADNGSGGRHPVDDPAILRPPRREVRGGALRGADFPGLDST